MFTGIIEEIGHVNNVKKGTASATLTIQAEKVLEGTHIGDSIAVNGVCLTVTGIYDNTFTADVMHETLNRSSLGKLVSGSAVNLERAMAADGRFGGHIVSGHIDGTGKVAAITKDDNAIWYQIKTDSGILKYIVEKGSVAIDGISLTVAKTDSQSFSVSIIPHTDIWWSVSLSMTPNLLTSMLIDMDEKDFPEYGQQCELITRGAVIIVVR